VGNGDDEREDVEANEDESDKSKLLFELICFNVESISDMITE